MARADPRPLLTAAATARPHRRTEARGCCERRLGSGIPLLVCWPPQAEPDTCAPSDRAGHVGPLRQSRARGLRSPGG